MVYFLFMLYTKKAPMEGAFSIIHYHQASFAPSTSTVTLLFSTSTKPP